MALSQQIPVYPIDRVMPFAAANAVIWAEPERRADLSAGPSQDREVYSGCGAALVHR